MATNCIRTKRLTINLTQSDVAAHMPDGTNDAEEPLAFLIRYEPTGETVLYATDTYKLPNRYPCINYWLVECNYTLEKVEALQDNPEHRFLFERLAKSHMSLERLCNAVLGAQPMSGMPRGGKLSDPTARIGIAVADGCMTDDMKILQKEIEDLEYELRKRKIVVHFVAAWLDGLNEKERWIIEKQVIDGSYWREVIFSYKAKFGDEYSKDGLKRIKKNALNKIYRIAS